MREFISIIEAATKISQKLDASAFIYLPPKGEKSTFAQCGSCLFFKPETKKCGIFGKNDKVTESQSCGLYIHGEPNEDQECRNIVTPKEAGLVDGPVRCKNCSWFDDGCELYNTLNKALPDIFHLDTEVDENGCCNAWQK